MSEEFEAPGAEPVTDRPHVDVDGAAQEPEVDADGAAQAVGADADGAVDHADADADATVDADGAVEVPADQSDRSFDNTARTGNHAVDRVLESLDELPDKPIEEHVAVFERAHEQLRGALDGPRPPKP